MQFSHLGQTWTLATRTDKPGAPLYFTPRWGDHGQKVFHCLRDKTTGLPLSQAAAVAAAKDLITAHFKGPDQYEALREQTKLRETLTVGAILAQWDAAGCPRPNGLPRSEAEQKRQRQSITVLQRWWSGHHVHAASGLHGQYARWRRSQVREGCGTGNRSLELEFIVLSNCFRWALSERLVKLNPFAERERYVATKSVRHCTDYMPGSPDEFHRLIGYLIENGTALEVIAAAQLCFMGLTGLRAGEPGHLRWDAQYTESLPQPGAIFPRTLEGREAELLAIVRLKSGLNPAVEVRPGLTDFLDWWKPYARNKWPDSKFWFPDPLDPTKPLCLPEDKRKRLSAPLDRATTALGLPERHPHGMRAYYVHVRRSQGASDATIADELGESTGAAIVASTYGRADQIRGDARFDFLPKKDAHGHQPSPAWHLLGAPQQTNIVAL